MILSIDLETYSEVDLTKSSVYRYSEDPSFEILLFGYAFDDEPVTVIDVAAGGIPDYLLGALTDPSITKMAYNASFERVCLSNYMKRRGLIDTFLPPEQWQCTMIHALSCGLPRSLAGVGQALGLSEEEAKMKEGSALIQWFCKPCKATKTNGGRTRNLPQHDMRKWITFEAYNARDVEVERTIRKMLESKPVPEIEWKAYWMDQRINDRGVMIDRQLMENAIKISQEHTAELSAEAEKLTGLENVNSVSQLKDWLGVDGSLDKKAIRAMRASGSLDLKQDRLLAIRQEMGKTSISKYEAMERGVCADGRIRGLFQFYGANRTGRWAGRQVQVQNLPQNHISDLDTARNLVIAGDRETLLLLYGNAPDALSQLIRTAFIAGEGRTFAVADFSAIEARVLAWLADEQWRMEVFRQGGDIYCASASQMFKVPVVKHGVNGHLRQKGKIAELACIAEGQLVLTDHGEIPIEQVTTEMRVWDGESWVTHGGVVQRGIKEVITYDGLTATPDHPVFIEGKAGPVPFGQAARNGSHLLRQLPDREDLWKGDDHISGKAVHPALQEAWMDKTVCADPLPKLRERGVDTAGEPVAWIIEGLSNVYPAEDLSEMAGSQIHGSKTTMHKPEGRKLQKLRGAWNKLRLCLRKRSLPVDDRKLRTAGQKHGAGQDRCERQLCSGKSQMGNTPGKLSEPKTVYDLINAGPNHRFMVSGVIVHNCGYGGALGAMKNMGGADFGLTDDEMSKIVADWRNANPNVINFWWAVDRMVKDALDNPGTIQRLPCAADRATICAQVTRNLLSIKLPSGRWIRYYKPRIETNKFGSESITYAGLDSGKWGRVETYGPKLVENIVQATSRDCLRDAMMRVSEVFPDIVMHVHDEMIVEVNEEQAEDALGYMQECMGKPIEWAPGLLLRGDGYITKYYRKD